MPNKKEDYIETRNNFIPQAEKFANEKCGKTHGKKENIIWGSEWNLAFFAKMDELVKKFYQDAADQWIIGSDNCRSYLNMGSWKTAKRWIQRHKAPLHYWIDGRPVFLKSEIDNWLKNTLKNLPKI